MRILHYSLGFPPYRRGGLTKYCLDLMTAQKMQNHEIAMCWPGEIGIIKRRQVSIKRHENYIVGKNKVENFEIKGLLPVPLLEGISNPSLFMETRNISVWECFLKEWNPEVIHFHTLMGLPIEFVEKAKELKIKTFFTAHDYYGICPRTTLVRNDGIICNGNSPNYCASCCINAPDYRKLAILQSSIYRHLKDSVVVKKLRKKHWDETKKRKAEDIKKKRNTDQENQYIVLRDYYVKLLKEFDMVHFNSNNTKNVYSSIIQEELNSTVISITHSMIQNNKIRKEPKKIIQFSYLGPDTFNKGYYLLKEVMTQLYQEGYRFVLNVYFNDNDEPFIVSHKSYRYDELNAVMDDANCVILPSLWNETFGFTVLEALSYGVPVVVSRRVGAKDLIVESKNGYVVEENAMKLKEKLRSILDHPDVLVNMNAYIMANTHIKTMDEHVREIEMLYKS